MPDVASRHQLGYLQTFQERSISEPAVSADAKERSPTVFHHGANSLATFKSAIYDVDYSNAQGRIGIVDRLTDITRTLLHGAGKTHGNLALPRICRASFFPTFLWNHTPNGDTFHDQHSATG